MTTARNILGFIGAVLAYPFVASCVFVAEKIEAYYFKKFIKNLIEKRKHYIYD